MTAQTGDRLRFGGDAFEIVGTLPFPTDHPRVEAGPLRTRWPGRDRVPRTGDEIEEDLRYCTTSTACWRGFIAIWAIQGERLFLARLVGGYRLHGDEPLPASWISTVIVLAAGPRSYDSSIGFSSRYEAVREIDVREGVVHQTRVVRARRVRGRRPVRGSRQRPSRPWGLNAGSPNWVHVPEAGSRFAFPTEVNPSRGAPEPEAFRERALRERFRAERLRQNLGFGVLARAVGLSPGKSGRIAEWERGQRPLRAELLGPLTRAVGLSEVETAELLAADERRYLEALEGWRDAPIRPTLEVRTTDGSRHLYHAPPGIEGDERAWAQACVDLAWRRGVLHLDRRTAVPLVPR